MVLHPTQIAKEISSFPFFKDFDSEMVLQISAMIRPTTFKSGQVLMKEGEANRALYFLKSGKVEVILNGEVIQNIDQPGEVIGEVSVATRSLAGTTVRVVSDAEFFQIEADDISCVPPKDKDRLEALLYRVYCYILADRLAKTNEKARLFEILNKELFDAQKALKKKARALLIEADRKQQQMIKMALSSTGVHLEILSDATELENKISSENYDLIISSEEFSAAISKIKIDSSKCSVILVSDRPAKAVIPSIDLTGVPYWINRNKEDRSSSIRAVLIALGKVLTQDIFGIQKYLVWSADIQQIKVTNSDSRDQLKQDMYDYLKKVGVRTTILDRIDAVAEELLMNAVYDAPTDSQGKSLFNHKSRKDRIQLESHQQSILSFGCDGNVVAISVADPFGALKIDTVIKYLKSCYDGQNLNTGDANKGGGGLGFHQIVENSDHAIFNVKEGVRTEVVCIFNVDGSRMVNQPALDCFFSKST